MKTHRFGWSRQRACDACSAAKVRCDRPYSALQARCDRPPGNCSRCTSRGTSCIYSQLATTEPRWMSQKKVPKEVDAAVAAPTSRAAPVDLTAILEDAPLAGDFSRLELVCSIEADEISNRWLKAYISSPDEAAKKYSTAIQGFMFRVLKSYAASTVRGRGIPPFMHPLQVTVSMMRWPLSVCLSRVRVCENQLPGSEGAANDILQHEMDTIYDMYGTYDDLTLLAAFQAYLIYSMVLFFRLGQQSGPFLRQAMVNLQELACASCKRGLVCTAEMRNARPKWEAWMVAEAKRRTLFTMYLFDGLLSAQDRLPTSLATELRGVPAPSSRSLWQVRSRYAWDASYNAHLVEWTEGCLHIDELWPIPEEHDGHEVAKRRGRVDRWLEDVDEFGTMLYAVTSCTHGKLVKDYYLPTDGYTSAWKMNLTERDQQVSADIPVSQPEPYSIFDKRQKALIVVLVSTAATFSGFAGNSYFPALPAIARDLHVSEELVNLTVTSYLIFQGLTPSLWGPLSDAKGRRIAYCCTFVLLIGACVGLAESRNYATLVALRCLQSAGSASTIALGAGVIGDITTRADRGGYMGVFQAGSLVPVALGPVVGGALAGSLGWRAIFWFLAAYSAAFLALLLALLPETLRAVVANGRRVPPSGPVARYPLRLYVKYTRVEWDPHSPPPPPPPPPVAAGGRRRRRGGVDVTGPLRILASKQAAPIIAFLATYYAVWQMSVTAMSTLFRDRYGLSETQIGLTFIANGAGAMVGTFVSGRILDRDYRRVRDAAAAAAAHDGPSSPSPSPSPPAAAAAADAADLEPGRDSSMPNHTPPAAAGAGAGVDDAAAAASGDFPLERARLRLIPIFALLQCLSVLVFGWTVQHAGRVPVGVPIASTFVTGWTAVASQSVITTYLVDVFPDRGAAASASLNLARCLLAAGCISAVMPLIDAVGVGWAFTVAVAAQLAALLAAGAQWRFGAKWRREAADESRSSRRRSSRGRRATEEEEKGEGEGEGGETTVGSARG
ncbi:MFS general substrate transporter [Xylariaceae sp. FL0804]|nr:MFS general substrate transporter [Xylariaceae sp. FL0804]